MTSQQIRQQFIDFFVQKHGHTFVPSASVVPHDDPTLLFTNAGMNQFKPIFLGEEKRAYVRAANTQKCIRAGGKHNDLDDVGRSRRHHTFFEMLGNWSFGDYFKRGAIEMAWELLTKVWEIDPTRLHVTCYEGDPANGVPRDDEAANLWKEIAGLPDDHIHYFGKDNFWEMGETGPCGPCSEIYVDRTPDKTGGPEVNGTDPRVMEIWNLVFIQYNRGAERKLTPLPAQHVDTGMGLERICQVLQGKSDNYATDLFEPYFAKISELSGLKYEGQFPSTDSADKAREAVNAQLRIDVAFRVIADHVRMATFAITDGAVPGNKGRNSVLRSVIRRAVRYGYQVMNLTEPFLYQIVPVVVSEMGDAFPELKRDPQRVADIIRREETDFLVTVDRGLKLFEEAARAAEASGEFPAETMLDLHTTYGFPSDMTSQLATERNLAVDLVKYRQLWEEFVRVSGKDRQAHSQVVVDLTGFAKTDDSLKYQGTATEATVLGWVVDGQTVREGRLEEDVEAGVIVDRTTFYAEQGGQVGDVGYLQTSTGRFDITSTERKGDWVIHWGDVDRGHIDVNQHASLHVDVRRSDTMRNHTATHLLNWALREVLGDGINQKGSLVDPDKLRYDFSHDQAVNSDQLALVERMVNEKIYSDLPVSATVMPLADAKKLAGVRAVFGEKYPDPVRVVAIGTIDPRRDASVEHSIEFCGGTHLRHTGEAGFFKILSEEGVSKGVRRIIAVTGRGAIRYMQDLDASVRQITQSLSASIEDVPKRIASMQDEIKQLKKKIQSGGSKADPVAAAAKLLEAAPALGPGKLIVGEIASASDEQLRVAMDSLKKKAGSYGIMLAAADDEKVNFVAAVSDDLIALGLKAGDWIRETAKVAGGGGGGRPQMAQAGGKDPAKIGEALELAKSFASQKISS